jgi:hypothetical protein
MIRHGQRISMSDGSVHDLLAYAALAVMVLPIPAAVFLARRARRPRRGLRNGLVLLAIIGFLLLLQALAPYIDLAFQAIVAKLLSGDL